MDSKEGYEKKYEEGYGTMYPEGHIIGFYEKILKYELNIDGSKGEKVFDFGCGNGTHPLYFASKGFEVYGVDIISSAIEFAKKRMPEYSENFAVIEPSQNIGSLFDTKFDVIIANQSLYYLPDTALEQTLSQIHEMLSPDGIVFFTMMGSKCLYYDLRTGREPVDGLYEVTLTGRLNETTYLSFIHNEEELTQKFHMFKPYFIGYYDLMGRAGSGFHYQFMGTK